MFPYQEKLSNFNISTRQSWASPTETLQEKKRNDPFHVTSYRLQGNEIMAYESLPKSC